MGRGAVGSWDRHPYQTVQTEQVAQKERALLEDQIRIGGLRADLWFGVTDGTRCACYKESTQQADRKCSTCYGIGYAPGYLKFGYDTVFLSATDSDITFTNTEITNTFKSSKIQLTDGSTTGIVESGDKSFSRAAVGATWAYSVSDFVRIADSSTTTVEYSLDAGSSWSDIANLPTANPASGSIRFRATLTRTSTAVLSPLFEIVRARYARIDLGTDISPINNEPRTGPWILAMLTTPVQQTLKSERGDFPSHSNTSYWTSGMSMFDPQVTPGSDAELITGPNVLISMLDGALTDKRYATTSWSYSDTFGYQVVSQTFAIRIADPSGPKVLVW